MKHRKLSSDREEKVMGGKRGADHGNDGETTPRVFEGTGAPRTVDSWGANEGERWKSERGRRIPAFETKGAPIRKTQAIRRGQVCGALPRGGAQTPSPKTGNPRQYVRRGWEGKI